MPDLGKHAAIVLGAYAVTLALLAALVLATWARGRSVRRRLAETEERLNRG